MALSKNQKLFVVSFGLIGFLVVSGLMHFRIEIVSSMMLGFLTGYYASTWAKGK